MGYEEGGAKVWDYLGEGGAFAEESGGACATGRGCGSCTVALGDESLEGGL